MASHSRISNLLFLPLVACWSACSSVPHDSGTEVAGIDAGHREGRVEVEEISLPARSPQAHSKADAAPAPVETVPMEISQLPQASPQSPGVVVHPAPDLKRSHSLSSEEAFRELVKGNERYVSGQGESRAPARHKPSGDAPLETVRRVHTVVLSCSDASVSPDRAFDSQGDGLFVVQVAGNVLGSAQVASVEYAIEKLGAKLIVVLGHESCEAVRMALHSESGKGSGSTDLDWLASEIRPHLGTGRIPASMMATSDKKLRKPSISHLNAVSENLIVRSAVIRSAVEKGELRVLRGLQSIETGRVEFWK